MKSINISNSKIKSWSSYHVTYITNSNVTYSTFSNNTSDGTETSHQGQQSTEFKIVFCNYYKIKGKNMASSIRNIYFINCSFYANSITELYFNAIADKIQVNKCYFDISDPSTSGLVTITESANSIYPENIHSHSSCSTELKLDPTEKLDLTENLDLIQYKRYFKFRRR